MKVAVASGKGGTGKTTVATNLAWVAVAGGRSVAYLDCDVEEPNGHLFLKPKWREQRTVTRPVPQVDESLCTHCGRCGEICRFGAIAPLGSMVLVFPELCHGCGGCALVCRAGAVREVQREIGTLRTGGAGQVHFIGGLLNVGEAMSPPLIRQVKAVDFQADLTIIDAPPGTSCPMLTAVRGCDLVLLVTEPTPFGLHDLTLAVETVRQINVPLGVIINRADVGDDRVATYCAAEGIPVLLTIPDDRPIAEAYSRGELLVTARPDLRAALADLVRRIEDLVTAQVKVGGTA